MGDEVFVESGAAAIRRPLDETTEEVLITAPTVEMVRVVGRVEDVEWPANVQLLTTETTAKQVRREFPTATRIADLVVGEDLSVRTVDGSETPMQPLLVTSETLTCVLLPGEENGGCITTGHEDLFHSVRDEYASQWEHATTFDLRTPAYSTILETAGDEFSEAFEVDVRDMLESAFSTRDPDDVIDEVYLVLLLGAKHGLQFYRLSRWGERIELGSQAKFSRLKNELEDAGVVTTEKVDRRDVGRPRQRLALPNEELRAASPPELLEAARSAL